MRSRIAGGVMSLCLGLLAPGAAGAADAPAAAPQPTAGSKPEAGSRATSASGAAARVNGVPIAKALALRELKKLLARKPAADGAEQERREAALHAEVLDRLIATELIWQQARAEGGLPSDAEVQAEIDRLRERFKDPMEFLAAVQAEGLSADRLREEVRKELAVRGWIERQVEAAVKEPPEAELKAYYQAHPDEFQRPESVRLRHILCRADKEAAEDVKAAARKKAEAALARVRKGEDFATVARQVSDDPRSAAEGGDIGAIPRGRAPQAIETAAFGLEPGAVAGPLESDFGYHVIQVTGKEPSRLLSLAEVEPKLKEFLLVKAKRERMEQAVAALRAKARVDVLP